MGTPLEGDVTKEYLQDMIKNMNAIVFIFHKNEEGQFVHTFCEGRILEQMKLLTEEVVGHRLEDFMPEESAAEKHAMYVRAWNGETLSYEGVSRNVHYIVNLSPVYKGEKVVEVIGTLVDIEDRIEKEHKLITNEQHFKSFFTYNPDPIFSLDINGYFTSVNSAGEQLTGHSEEQMKQRTFIPYITEDHQMNVLKYFQRVIRGESLTFRCAIHNTNKERRELRITAVPTVVNGEITGVYGTARDITEQLRDRAALELSEQRHRILVEHSPIAIAVHVDGVLKYANPAFVSLFKADHKNNLIGLSKWELIPSDYHDYISTLEETLEFMEFGYRRRESKIRRLDGMILDVEVTAMPISFEGEKSVLVMLSNISERKKVEQKIEKIHRQNELILNTAGDGILSISNVMSIDFANDAALGLLGWTRSELIGRNVSMLFRSSELLGKFNVNEPSQSIHKERNIHIMLKNGGHIVADITITPILEEADRIGTVLVIKDVTQQQKLDELMIRSDKLSVLGELAAGIAHEIRNPLTSLKGFIQLIQSVTENKYEDYCNIMLDELERVNGIVGEFLMLAKPQHAALSLQNPIQLMKDVVSFLKSEALLNNVDLHEDYIEEEVCLIGEGSQLKQVFINLLKNAIESMESGGNIHITATKRKEHRLQITIQDEGCGIEANRLTTLGQPFYTTKDRGTGLGLMICYKIIENHHGKLTFNSEINVGTTVEILLPIEGTEV